MAATIPLSWNDPLFSDNATSGSVSLPRGGTLSNKSITQTGSLASVVLNGAATLDDIRISSQEGVRIGGSGNVTISNSWLEATGQPGDHADTIQAYAPGATGTVTVTNSVIVAHNNYATAGFFVADNYTGTFNFENVVFQGGPFGLRIHADVGGDQYVSLKDVYFVGPFLNDPFMFLDYGGHEVNIVKWENVRYATIVNGELVPGALIPPPKPVEGGGGGGAPGEPDLTESVSVVGSTTVAAGAGMTISSTVSNLGSGASPASTAGIYLSTDATVTTSDTLLSTVASPQLAAGSVDTKNLSVTLPANLAAGTYYIGGIADYNNQVAETTEGNNKGNTVAITVGGGGTTAKPDLTESVSVVGSTTVAAGAGMMISSTVSNLGSGASPASTAGIYLSTDATVTTSDTLLSTVASPQLAAGSVDTKNLSVTLPANLAAGTYYIGGIADYNNQVNETTGYNNNGNTVAITVGGGGGTLTDDELLSDGGDNVLVGGANGAGGDTVSYENATAGVTVRLNTTSPQNTVGAGTDTLSGFENLTGSNFNDMLTGTNGNNVLIGLDGNDTLIGLAGNDTLTGGRGAGSADTFVFNPGFGNDRITDFSTWRDVMQFSPALFANYAAVMDSTTQVGADTVITFAANDTVTLANVSASSLSSTNFRFA